MVHRYDNRNGVTASFAQGERLSQRSRKACDLASISDNYSPSSEQNYAFTSPQSVVLLVSIAEKLTF